MFAWRCVAAMVLMAAGLGGCKSETAGPPEGPKALLETLHQAAVAGDLEKVIDCVDPAMREPFTAMVEPSRQFTARAESLAGLVEEKIGKDQAALVRRPVQDMKIRSPLKDAVADGRINWEKVRVELDGNRATVDVAGAARVVEMKLLDGRWYVVSSEAESFSPDKLKDQARRGADRVRKLTEAMDQVERSIRDGTITGANFEVEFTRLMAAAGS